MNERLAELATNVARAATARIGSRQRMNAADRAYRLALDLKTPEATSAALLAGMVACAWNDNKAANQRRLRWANRNMLSGSTLDIQRQRSRVDFDAKCARTYDEANRLRSQALDASRKLRALSRKAEGPPLTRTGPCVFFPVRPRSGVPPSRRSRHRPVRLPCGSRRSTRSSPLTCR